ncbi:probable U3 small nucleolar RNA-associated protein 11 isoform X2 [Salvia miltiorrhiza]|uniref:probable U3 small nucleolar RNA-associated protein 11 isoform X2 n=1 Tax=Salvia miltiorrhiza TaxID=226208 RepID=UPI0025ACBCAB|nr:probable U3 small nucleolar RNA-associated protein 11 isoform X2 [Salvia miltiorrhiza]
MAADLPLPPPENQKSICHLPSPYGAWSRTAARQPLCCSRPLLFSLQLTEAREIRAQASEHRENHSFEDFPKDIKRKIIASYRELEPRRSRVKELEKIYMDMAMQKELQEKG